MWVCGWVGVCGCAQASSKLQVQLSLSSQPRHCTASTPTPARIRVSSLTGRKPMDCVHSVRQHATPGSQHARGMERCRWLIDSLPPTAEQLPTHTERRRALRHRSLREHPAPGDSTHLDWCSCWRTRESDKKQMSRARTATLLIADNQASQHHSQATCSSDRACHVTQGTVGNNVKN